MKRLLAFSLVLIFVAVAALLATPTTSNVQARAICGGYSSRVDAGPCTATPALRPTATATATQMVTVTRTPTATPHRTPKPHKTPRRHK